MVIRQDDLLSALKAVRTIPNKDTSSIWSNVVIRPIGPQMAEVRAVAHEGEVCVAIPAECSEADRAVAVCHHVAQKVISMGDGSAWSIGPQIAKVYPNADGYECPGQWAAFRQGRFGWDAPTISPDSLPDKADEGTLEPMVVVQRDRFLSALASVSAAMSDDIGRPEINGVEVSSDQANQIRFTATDGHVLLTSSCRAAIAEEFRPFTIDRNAVKAMIAAGSEVDLPAMVCIEANESFCRIKAGDTSISLRLVQSDYPAWRRCIPTIYKTSVVVDRKAIIGGMTRCKKMSSRTSNSPIVRIAVNGCVKFMAQNPENGDFEMVVEGAAKADSSMPDVESAFNPDKVAMLAKAFDAKNINWFLPDVCAYCSLMVEAGSEPLVGLTALVMPVRV